MRINETKLNEMRDQMGAVAKQIEIRDALAKEVAEGKPDLNTFDGGTMRISRENLSHLFSKLIELLDAEIVAYGHRINREAEHLKALGLLEE